MITTMLVKYKKNTVNFWMKIKYYQNHKKRLKCNKHDISTIRVNKTTLSSNDDKIMATLDCRIISKEIWKI